LYVLTSIDNQLLITQENRFMNNQIVELSTNSLRLSLIGDPGQWRGFRLAVRNDDGWQSMSVTEPISEVVFQDEGGNRQELALTAQEMEQTQDRLSLRGQTVDGDGVSWNLSIHFAVDHDQQITADYRLEVDMPRKLLRWLGPGMHVGEGTFGAAKDEALFPGLEYLLDDEPSSDTRFAAEKYANRTVPHPYKITIPLMAVSHGGCSVGLLWDPNQDWGSAWRHPAALFSSPNRLQGNANNHWMALFAPGAGTRWVEEGSTEASKPYDIRPDRPSTLSARLVGVADGVIGVVRAWVEAYGLPSVPAVEQSYSQNVDLSVRSYLDVAWDETAEGWHHTLADPWGPRYEPGVANQLWRYATWPGGDPALQARARDQVERAVNRVRQAGASEERDVVAGEKVLKRAPHLDLALAYGQLEDALETLAVDARQALAEQHADGYWPWTPRDVADIADFKTADRLSVLGEEGESSTGLTGMRVKPVLNYALCTGEPNAVDAVLRAADWCNAQRRPEGAQVWELHLHIPDVLAAPYLMQLNLGAYQLTGNEAYLDTASRWAWTGLPFTFLWNGYYRPIMRYGTIPVFGVTFHDVQPWFGVIVHWNGLVYADALFHLARYRRSDGPLDWRHLAEGITHHGIQEQIPYGPHLGMYPDAFNTVCGDEEYTWWLNPQLIGLNTFPLAGIPVNPETRVLKAGAAPIHVTSGGRVIEATYGAGEGLVLQLENHSEATSFTIIAATESPTAITCEGMALPVVEDLDAAAQGWQWLPEHRVALVKVLHEPASLAIHCLWE
jgi:hypothetical protein